MIIIETMKTASLFLIAGFLNATCAQGPAANPNNDTGFAVIELFTSEGCSSCPPADALVARIQKEYAGRPVYLLAYHVDYWNYLGWKDVFSAPPFSDRQKQYAAWLKARSVYTPQVVVNGNKEFVGTNEQALRNSMTTDLQKTPTGKLTIKIKSQEKAAVNVEYQAIGFAGSNYLLLAIVQKSASTQVKRGENSGKTLAHVQVVRSFQTVALNNKSKGTVAVNLPEDLDQKDAEIIAIVQNNANGEIAAAAKVED